jgi:predicted GH43/DUF377 family glycosyl hydrolase
VLAPKYEHGVSLWVWIPTQLKQTRLVNYHGVCDTDYRLCLFPCAALLTLKTTKEIARLPYPLLKPENE